MSRYKKISELQNQELEKALLLVSGFFDLSMSKIKGKSRVHPIPDARSIFIIYCLNQKGFSGPITTRFINQTPSMAIYANHKVTNQYNLNPMYIKFLNFLKDRDIKYYISKIESYELRLKTYFIHKLIFKRFKTEQFREQMESKLKDIIFMMEGKKKQDSMILLHDWFEDFTIDFVNDSDEVRILLEFEQIGT